MKLTQRGRPAKCLFGVRMTSTRGGTIMERTRAIILVENNYEDLEVWYPKLRMIEAGYDVKEAGTGDKAYASSQSYPGATDGNSEDFRAGDCDIGEGPGGWARDL